MDTNHIYRWTAKQCFLKNNAVDWNHFGWTKFSSCWLLPNDLFQSPQSASLANHNLLPCVSIMLLSSSTSPVSCWIPGKATEESWAEGGFCMLVKKNNLCQRKVLQQLCCKTCTFQGWAAEPKALPAQGSCTCWASNPSSGSEMRSKAQALESDGPVCEFSLCCLPAVWPWVSDLPPLGLGFLTWKIPPLFHRVAIKFK